MIPKKRLHFFTGKGGVGKSTVTALAALRLASEGKRVLIIDLDPYGSIPHIFKSRRLTFKPKKLAPNIDGILATSDAALREYVTRHVKIKKISDWVFDNSVIKFFIDAAPGIEEIALMGKIYYLDQEMSRNKPKWDVLLVDAPATGHGLYLFKMPKVFIDISRVGPLARQTKGIFDMVANPERAAIHLVTIPEELPVQETIELYEEVKKSGLTVGKIFLNRMLPEVSETDDIGDEQISKDLKDKVTKTLQKLMTRRKIQQYYKEDLSSKTNSTPIDIPWILDKGVTLESLEALSTLWT